jgi:hypothetical protein
MHRILVFVVFIVIKTLRSNVSNLYDTHCHSYMNKVQYLHGNAPLETK